MDGAEKRCFPLGLSLFWGGGIDKGLMFFSWSSWPWSSPKRALGPLSCLPLLPGVPLTPFTDTPALRPWSVSVRRGHRESNRVRWRQAQAPERRGWAVGSWNTGGSGC